LRRIGTHAGRSVVKADSPDELRSLAPSFAGQSCYLIQYIETAAGSPYHRRARTFWVDGASHPMAWTFNDRWNVRAAGRARPMSRHQWMVDEERAFLDDPSTILGAHGLRALDGLGRALGLEFFGIDAAPLPSGDVVVFEANPAMDSRAHFFEGFEYLWTYFDRLVGAVNALVAKRASRR
jgi:glutathione synthase/RimK-type ligase-like ATP-grasp enzyme